ncbi:cytochrome c oxidase subunit II [Pyrobaculum aerophilum]|uniref:cytochrome c oxidase subunit II n=1 Tax=Pyrobaculum aerophilum TaxID=13773 RepID=UPI002FDAD933
MERGKLLEYMTIFGAAAILGVLAYIAAVGLYEIDNYGAVAEKTAFGAGQYETIKVTAYRYGWIFEYPNGSKSLNTLYIKAGKLYRLELTSSDVVHAFYIRELGYKYDTVPGFVYTVWLKVDKPGVYNVLCAEFCGAGHYRMLGRIVVEP